MGKDGERNWVKVAALAAVFGITPQRIHGIIKELPAEAVRLAVKRGEPTWINGPAFVSWWVERAVQRRRPVRGENGDPLLVGEGGPASPALEKYREARAALAELELGERRRDLLPRSAVHEVFGRVAFRLRDAGEQLQREHGSEAHEVLNEALDDAEREMESI